ncbi:MAG: NAD-dependent deacylase [Deltaproteobacteria bacterium]|nr:NAD-dependent deacylase [Candidatus Anaeroferrophillus wilburensis]MBN2888249.1 NAD-dependent deacylase [Deltaproteobacteria bacterium]
MKRVLPTDRIAAAAAQLRKAKRVVALTGAGISVDSGIPAFRGSQGLWEHYDPQEYAHIDAFISNPRKVWRMLAEMLALVYDARPNPAHLALSAMEANGLLQAVVTQNVDGLHQAAGSKRVVEFHGNTRNLTCLSCNHREAIASFAELNIPPLCPRCQMVMKPDVVFFGEAIPPAAQSSAVLAASQADLMLVIGTSAVVYPVADLPWVTKRNGGTIVEINLEPSPLTKTVADVVLLGSASDIMPALVAGLA